MRLDVSPFCLIVFDGDNTLWVPKSGGEFRQPGESYVWMPGREPVIKALIESDVAVAIATNQGGVGFFEKLTEADVRDAIYALTDGIGILRPLVNICFEHPQARKAIYRCPSIMRKPYAGMIWKAMFDTNILDPARVWMIGDRPEDQESAENAGVEYSDAETFFAHMQRMLTNT